MQPLLDALHERFDGRDGVIFLSGDLAAGKTTLVQRYVGSSEVSSPTFSLQNCYEGDVYHYDLYNITTEEFMHKGLLEELEKPGLHFIEWGDEALRELLKSAGFAVTNIDIKNLNNSREYTIYDA